jgi:hypothetical protein
MEESELALLGQDIVGFHREYERLLDEVNAQLRDITTNYNGICFARRKCRLYTMLADLDVVIDEAEDLITRAAFSDTLTAPPAVFMKYTQFMREELKILRNSRHEIESTIQMNSCCREAWHWVLQRVIRLWPGAIQIRP